MIQMHIFFKRYRVIFITITAFFLWLCYDAWQFYKEHFAEMTTESAAAFSTIYLTMIGVLKYVLENLNKDTSHD